VRSHGYGIGFDIFRGFMEEVTAIKATEQAKAEKTETKKESLRSEAQQIEESRSAENVSAERNASLAQVGKTTLYTA
jgi:hypothetical protein